MLSHPELEQIILYCWRWQLNKIKQYQRLAHTFLLVSWVLILLNRSSGWGCVAFERNCIWHIVLLNITLDEPLNRFYAPQDKMCFAIRLGLVGSKFNNFSKLMFNSWRANYKNWFLIMQFLVKPQLKKIYTGCPQSNDTLMIAIMYFHITQIKFT